MNTRMNKYEKKGFHVEPLSQKWTIVTQEPGRKSVRLLLNLVYIKTKIQWFQGLDSIVDWKYPNRPKLGKMIVGGQKKLSSVDKFLPGGGVG